MVELRELGPSQGESQSARGYLYIPDCYDQGDAAEGSMVLIRVTGGRESEECYRVQVQRDRRGQVESVILHKESDGEFREVTVAGPRATCSCWGFKRWKGCAHADAVVDLVGTGRLEPEEVETSHDWREDVEEMDWHSVYQQTEE